MLEQSSLTTDQIIVAIRQLQLSFQKTAAIALFEHIRRRPLSQQQLDTLLFNAMLEPGHNPIVQALLKTSASVTSSLANPPSYFFYDDSLRLGWDSPLVIDPRNPPTLEEKILSRARALLYDLVDSANSDTILALYQSKQGQEMGLQGENDNHLIRLLIGHLKLATVIKLIDCGLNPTFKDPKGNTLLHFAVRLGRLDLVQQLTRRNLVDCNSKNMEGLRADQQDYYDNKATSACCQWLKNNNRPDKVNAFMLLQMRETGKQKRGSPQAQAESKTPTP